MKKYSQANIMLKLTKAKKNLLFIFYLAIILLQFLQILYFKQSDLTNKYDFTYWKDRYEHSQWQLPLSGRIIGDDGLYAYAGYKVINGSNPIAISPEVPPVGKYFFGASIRLFNNPVYISFLFGIGTLVLFYTLCKKLLDSSINAMFLSILLFLEPLFFSQFTVSLLDIIQLFFLLSTITATFYLGRKSYLLAIICGLSLGFFAQTKIPIFFPIIFILEISIFLKRKFLNLMFPYFFGLTIGLLVPYTVYFFSGNTIMNFLQLQKYIGSFYLKSRLVANHSAVWLTLFTGKFIGLNTNILSSVREWSILWPIIGILSVISVVFVRKEKNRLQWFTILLFPLIGLIFFSLLPFYTRYLLLVLPFMYLLSFFVVQKILPAKYLQWVMVLVLVVGVIRSIYSIYPVPDTVLSDFYYNLSHGYFQDIYSQDISDKNSTEMSREAFFRLSQSAWNQETIRKVSIKELGRQNEKGIVKVTIRMTYFTQDLGKFEEQKSFYLTKERQDWKILWNWDILGNGFTPGNIFYKNIEVGKRGNIFDKNGKALAQDRNGFLISIIPCKIDTKRENEMLKFISELINVEPVHIQNAYLENSYPCDSINLGTVFKELSEEDKKKLASFSGIDIDTYPTRIYDGLESSEINNTLFEENDTKIYSSSSYHGFMGIEKKYEEELSGQNGGDITLKGKNNRTIRTIIKKDKKTGKDVTLSL